MTVVIDDCDAVVGCDSTVRLTLCGARWVVENILFWAFELVYQTSLSLREDFNFIKVLVNYVATYMLENLLPFFFFLLKHHKRRESRSDDILDVEPMGT